jgi:hypothetical protein
MMTLIGHYHDLLQQIHKLDENCHVLVVLLILIAIFVVQIDAHYIQIVGIQQWQDTVRCPLLKSSKRVGLQLDRSCSGPVQLVVQP